MNVSLVMTIIGDDRPGLVESLATLVAKHEGNWVESRMANLAGQFAGILRVQVAAEVASALMGDLKALESYGLKVTVTSEDEAAHASVVEKGNRNIVHLELVGQDRSGIVKEISRVLAAREVNVEELHTECVSAPMSGEALFKASAQLDVPRELSLDDLRADLERIASDLMVDISIEAE